MISKFFIIAILFVGLTVQAQISGFPTSFPINPPTVAVNPECNVRIQGGVDGFPWSSARPFPWADIQGVWKLKDGVVPYFLKAKVTRTTTNRKILNLMIVSDGDCSRSVAQGVGYIDSSERNVIRAIINDGTSKYQMKIALFDIKDLAEDASGCDEGIMAASLQVLGSLPQSRSNTLVSAEEGSAENILLKKISNDLGSICKKLGTR